MEELKREIDKYIFPGIMIILGLILVISGNAYSQPTWFIYAGLAITITGVLSVVYALGWISRMIHYVLLLVLAGTCGVFGYTNFRTIKDPIDFQNEKIARYEVVKQRLSDIRDAELAFKKVYGRYTGGFDSLIHFVRTDSIMDVKAEGVIPDYISQEMADSLGVDYFQLIEIGFLTEWQCIQLARKDTSFHFRRDTFYKPVETEIFLNEKAMEKRTHPYYLDSLPYVPFTNGKAKFSLQSGFIDKNGGKAPVFMAIDTHPFDSTDVYQIGSMDDVSTNGNWGGN